MSVGDGKAQRIGDELLERIHAVIAPGDVVHTIATPKPNHIAAISDAGIEVETEQSIAKDIGPQLVPAWMIVRAWNELQAAGRLEQTKLVGPMKVHRSAFIFGLFARFPDVEVESTRPSVLRLV